MVLMSNNNHEDWFIKQRRDQALREAYIGEYADASSDVPFYAIESFDTHYCEDCEDDTEILEEIKVSFSENPLGDVIVNIKRIRNPRIYCRECLTGIELE